MCITSKCRVSDISIYQVKEKRFMSKVWKPSGYTLQAVSLETVNSVMFNQFIRILYITGRVASM